MDLSHRNKIGGLWNEIGDLSYNFLIEQGLKPDHNLLDLGCGCLRVGIKLIPYLDKYYGFDSNRTLLDKGLEIEIPLAELEDKLEHIYAYTNSNFDLSEFKKCDIEFDYVFAMSLFTHLDSDSIELCLSNLKTVLSSDGKFFATYFEVEDDIDLKEWGNDVTTSSSSDPYHYTFSEIQSIAKKSGFTVEKIIEFEHPRNQSMLSFKKIKRRKVATKDEE